MPSGRLCLDPAVDVDHIKAGDDHTLENLRCICDWHHKAKSAREGAMAYNRKINKAKRSFRRTEVHPGLVQ